MESPVQVPPPSPGDGKSVRARGSALLRFRASAANRRVDRDGVDPAAASKVEAMVDYIEGGGALDALVENLAGEVPTPKAGDLDSLADAATVSLHDAGYEPFIQEVEVSPEDSSVYVYMDERAQRTANGVLSVLAGLGEASQCGTPAQYPALGLYIWRLCPRGARPTQAARDTYLVPPDVRESFARVARRPVVIAENVISLLVGGPVSIIECARLPVETEVDLLCAGVVLGAERVDPVDVLSYAESATDAVADALSKVVLESRARVVECAPAQPKSKRVALLGVPAGMRESLRKLGTLTSDRLIDRTELLSEVLVDEDTLLAHPVVAPLVRTLRECAPTLRGMRSENARRALVESRAPSAAVTPALRAYLLDRALAEATPANPEGEEEPPTYTPSSTLRDPTEGPLDHQDPDSEDEVEKAARELLAGEDEGRTIGAGGPLVNQIAGVKNEAQYRPGDSVIRVVDHQQYRITGLDAEHASLVRQDGSDTPVRLPRAQWDSEAAGGRIRSLGEGRAIVSCVTEASREAVTRHLGDRAWVSDSRLGGQRALIEVSKEHLPWLREKLTKRLAARDIKVLG